MSRNRILSICCCLPVIFNSTFTLANASINLKTPFVAEIIVKEERSSEIQIKDLRARIGEQIKVYEEYQAELERQRIEKEKEEARLAAIEEQKRKEEQERIEKNRIYCTFEVSFYTTAADEGSGTGIGASGEYVQPWVSIALPKNIPFYSTATIEGLGTFVNHDTGGYIQWTNDGICRVDVCVSSKEEAYRLGRFKADGYIDLNR